MKIFAFGAAAFFAGAAFAAAVTLSENTVEMPTYPFFDPDPVPCTGEKRYPYFRYDGSSRESTAKEWKTIRLDNGKISVDILSELGGKVWGATDKATGFDFIYRNHVAKFRDVAMRGPWTSGGVEWNFGIIGHAPSCSTPVDWFARTNSDGSASCFVASDEYITRSRWQVEIRLKPDADSFDTRTTWYNASGLPQPCYHWANAAFSVRGNPRFLFSGEAYIGHEGDRHAWPVDSAGRPMDTYGGNAFGGNKSYHVLPGDAGKFGIWWPERGLGAVHLTDSWRKYGRKIWLWALSREGGIWEDLLTDEDGQYTELQSGRGFNQPRRNTYKTPFKHPEFNPGATETFAESWGVVRKFDELEKSVDVPVARPDLAPQDFDWRSAWGLCVRARQHLLEREDAEAEKSFKAALAKDPFLSPALAGLAAIEMRRGRYGECHALCRRALAIDAYDTDANYLDGFAFFAEGDTASARDRLGVAAFDRRNRSAAYALVARSFLYEGNAAEADKAAALALSSNDANFDALLVRLIAARGSPEASGMAKEALEKYPLFHAARYELEGTAFSRFVRNELPEQTFIELGSWYAETGLRENALDLFALAGENPIALVSAAHLRKDAAALAKAAALPVSGVFPFRRETLPALRWAAKSDGNWKFRYYLAVALASFHLDAEADALLDGCGNKPDEDVFYLFRAGRRSGASRLADLLRAKELKDSWRTGRALCRHFAQTGDWAQMLGAAQECDRRFPGRSPIQIARATALVRCGRPKDAIEYLETQTVLPSEFGDDAMEIWHEAQKLLGLPQTWPENLGKGEPFGKE